MIDTADIANYAEDNTPYSEGKKQWEWPNSYKRHESNGFKIVPWKIAWMLT